MIIASPKPVIDVFVMLKEAPLLLLSGGNPYAATFSQVYPGVIDNYFTYWPAAFLLQIPFIYLFHDPRVLMVISDLVCAILIYKIGRKNKFAQIFTLIYLYRPNSNFIIEQSWLTPLVLMLFFLSIYELIANQNKKDRKTMFSAFFMGVLGSVQPYFLMIVPLIIFKISNIIKYALVLILTLVIFVLPFYLWNQKEFISDTILFFIKSAKDMPSVPVYRSLNLNTLYYIFTNRDFPTFLSVFTFVTIFLAVFSRMKKAIQNKAFHKNYSSLLLTGIILVYLSFYMLLKFSFINYYYFITGIILFMVSHIYRKVDSIT